MIHKIKRTIRGCEQYIKNWWCAGSSSEWTTHQDKAKDFTKEDAEIVLKIVTNWCDGYKYEVIVEWVEPAARDEWWYEVKMCLIDLGKSRKQAAAIVSSRKRKPHSDMIYHEEPIHYAEQVVGRQLTQRQLQKWLDKRKKVPGVRQ